MELEKHIELAANVVKEGIPFFANGVFGIKKGIMAVHLNEGNINLVCGNLVPIELRQPDNPKAAQTLQEIKKTILDIQKTWFGS